MLKKILFPLCSIFLIYQSIQLVTALLKMYGEMPLGLLILWAYLLNLFVTGVFAITGFAHPTHRLLPQRYYRIRNAQALKKWYRWLGVKYFKMGLMLLFWGRKNNRKKYFNGTKAGVENFIYQTKQSEIGHLLPFIVLSLLSILFLSKGLLLLSAFTFGINFIGNFYPIVLQRHHRIRLERMGF